MKEFSHPSPLSSVVLGGFCVGPAGHRISTLIYHVIASSSPFQPLKSSETVLIQTDRIVSRNRIYTP
jgi:hypothetical protein